MEAGGWRLLSQLQRSLPRASLFSAFIQTASHPRPLFNIITVDFGKQTRGPVTVVTAQRGQSNVTEKASDL